MLRQASKRNTAAIRAARVTLMRALVDQIAPALDGPFDAILAVNSLGFWPAPAERLAELRRRLAPGGRVASRPGPACPGATADTSRSAAREIENLLRDAGFAHLTLALSPPWPASSPPAQPRTPVTYRKHGRGTQCSTTRTAPARPLLNCMQNAQVAQLIVSYMCTTEWGLTQRHTHDTYRVTSSITGLTLCRHR